LLKGVHAVKKVHALFNQAHSFCYGHVVSVKESQYAAFGVAVGPTGVVATAHTLVVAFH
jgi:hypothetical protein